MALEIKNTTRHSSAVWKWKIIFVLIFIDLLFHALKSGGKGNNITAKRISHYAKRVFYAFCVRIRGSLVVWPMYCLSSRGCKTGFAPVFWELCARLHSKFTMSFSVMENIMKETSIYQRSNLIHNPHCACVGSATQVLFIWEEAWDRDWDWEVETSASANTDTTYVKAGRTNQSIIEIEVHRYFRRF